jgi:succinylarginine dihydrolase
VWVTAIPTLAEPSFPAELRLLTQIAAHSDVLQVSLKICLFVPQKNKIDRSMLVASFKDQINGVQL